MPDVGLVTHPLCLEHDPGPGHPERPARLRAVLEAARAGGLADRLELLEAEPAPRAALEAAHRPHVVRAIEQACGRGRALLDRGDTYVSARSFDAALHASGGALQAAQRVLDGRWRRAFVAVRPPGHHAEEDQALGFCLFNHVAVAARWLRTRPGIERVAIVDWDVHHGNGTQHGFERDPSVFYASLHQFPHYPGTGAAHERGLGEGEGATLNLPLPAGTGDARWLAAFENELLPALDAFRPDFVLVSAGFDAHRDDPLAGMELSTDAFRVMTRGVLDLAGRHAQGRLVSLLEGGYNLEALAACTTAHLDELLA